MAFKLKISAAAMVVCCLWIPSLSKDFDFFFFVQQWPGAYCDTQRGCCYASTGKPTQNFTIHGLWPNYNNGSYPLSCDRRAQFNETQVVELVNRMNEEWPTLQCPTKKTSIKFWKHEWKKHGTCSHLDEHAYFNAALDLKDKVDLLRVLEDAGIEADGRLYNVTRVRGALAAAGLSAAIDCNVDPSRTKMLYQIYLCADKWASQFIDCPVLPRSDRCGKASEIEFPGFNVSTPGAAVI